jgi:translation initiation factor 3 subunit C
VKEQDEKKKKKAEDKKASDVDYVRGNIAAMLENLANELRKSLVEIDPHASDYVSRLKDEQSLLGLLERAQGYYVRLKKEHFANKVCVFLVCVSECCRDSLLVFFFCSVSAL